MTTPSREAYDAEIRGLLAELKGEWFARRITTRARATSWLLSRAMLHPWALDTALARAALEFASPGSRVAYLDRYRTGNHDPVRAGLFLYGHLDHFITRSLAEAMCRDATIEGDGLDWIPL